MAYTTINKSTEHFNTKLYTGTGSSQGITGVGFQPDLVWCKNRTSAQSHAIVDSIRGRKALQSNATDAEYVMDAGKDFGTFDSDGFTVLVPNQLNSFNFNGGSIASWNWKANGAGSANTAGSINSTVSANTTSGFSIVSFTGTGSLATVGHGLGVAPSMIIIKKRSDSGLWITYHASLGAGKYIVLEETSAAVTTANAWNNTEPTSSVFTINTNGNINTNGETFIAYCFAEKQGFSKFGSYVGNGSTDGTFVYTGFKPAFVIAKGSSFGSAWTMSDNKRDSYNVINGQLFSNTSNAEDTSASNSMCDYLSNGFKMRSTGGAMNSSGNTYIYMAFAEEPLVGTNNIPATAR